MQLGSWGAFRCSKVEVQILALDPAHVVKPSFKPSIGGARPATIPQYEQGYLTELEILCGMATMIKVAVMQIRNFSVWHLRQNHPPLDR